MCIGSTRGSAAGLGCAYRTKAISTVRFVLADNGAVAIEDNGELLEDFGSVAGGSQHLTTWSRVWHGSWSEADETIKLRLEPGETRCERKSDAGSTDVPCSQSAALEVRCSAERIRLHRPKHAQERVWICELEKGTTEESSTQFPWVFGIDNPIVARDRVRGRRWNRRYARSPNQPRANLANE